MTDAEGFFESSVRSTGDLAGVFEFDGETAYFYLYDLAAVEGKKVVGAIRIALAPLRFGEAESEIAWAKDERFVGLFIKDQLCAAFDAETRNAFGAESDAQGFSGLPEFVLKSFEPTSE